jgi:hypothetical protein
VSSNTRVLHTATWVYFTSRLPERFIRSPEVVKEAIMTDINDLVQEFWRTSRDGAVGASFFAMRRLFGILKDCYDNMNVCFDIFPFLRLSSTWLKKCTESTTDAQISLSSLSRRPLAFRPSSSRHQSQI